MRITGSCHCGNIVFALDWLPAPTEIPARACGCSFCIKHGGVWTACPQGTLRVRIGDASALSKYAFETRTADFHVCTRCGVVPVVTSEIDGRLYAVVSVHAFDNVPREMLRHAPVSFDGERESDRLARRRRGWIGDVRFEPA